MAYEIVNCCWEMKTREHNISVAQGHLEDVSPMTPYYWTGEETAYREIPIKYCPFCGEQIKIRRVYENG